MKNNKGFGLVAILIIIVAVLAVGGVLYYNREKSLNTFPSNTPTNSYQPPVSQNGVTNIPVVNSNTNTQKNITPPPASVVALTLTSKDNGNTFTVVKGQTISITLCNPGDGGLQFDTPQYNSSILSLTSHINVPLNPPNPPGYMGGCYGNDVFKFQALNTGSSELVITASQAWTGGDKLSPMFSATVVVQAKQDDIKPNTCIPKWQCGWGQCNNGSQSMTAVDSNNCGLPYQGSPALACPALARSCN